MTQNSGDNFSQTTQIFIQNLCLCIPDYNTENISDELDKFATLIDRYRHEIRVQYIRGVGTAEDDKIDICLRHAWDRLTDINPKDEGAEDEFNRIISELRKMNETAHISEELYNDDSENDL